MKTLLAFIGSIVVLAGGFGTWYYFFYLPKHEMNLNLVDWIKKSVDYQTTFAKGTITLADLKAKGGTFGAVKGSYSLDMKLVDQDKITFTLMCDGKLMKTMTVNFSNQTIS